MSASELFAKEIEPIILSWKGSCDSGLVREKGTFVALENDSRSLSVSSFSRLAHTPLVTGVQNRDFLDILGLRGCPL